MAQDDASRRKIRRRLVLGLGGACVVVAIGLVVFVVFTLRERANACAAMLGDLGELERFTGKSLVKGREIAGEIDCTVEVRERTGGNPILVITNRHASREAEVQGALAAQRWAATEPLALPPHEGTLFVFARKAPTVADMDESITTMPAPAELATPRHHAVVFRHGEIVTELRLDSAVFDVANAKELAAAVARRANP